MIPKEVLQHIRRIHIRTSHRANDMLAGLDGLEIEQTIRSAYRLQQYKEA